MSRDNNTNFDSWDTKGYNKDTRHAPDGKVSDWDNQFSDLNDQWTTHQTLSQLEAMLKSSDPKVRALASSIVSEKSGAAASLKAHNDARVEALKKQVAKPRGNNRRPWDSMAISREVKDLLNGKS